MRKVHLFRGTKNKHIADGVFVFCCVLFVFEFVFCPSLKNDGRDELRFSRILNTCLSFLNEVKNPGRG